MSALHNSMHVPKVVQGTAYYPQPSQRLNAPSGGAIVNGFGQVATEAASWFGTLSAASPAQRFDIVSVSFPFDDSDATGNPDGTDCIIDVYLLGTGWVQYATFFSNRASIDRNFDVGLSVTPENRIAGFRVRGAARVSGGASDACMVVNYVLH